MNCVSHSTVLATGQCTQCTRLWCAQCIKSIKAGGGSLQVCPKCNVLVRDPPKVVRTGALDLHDLLMRPFRAEGLLTAGAIAVTAWLSWLPGIGRLLALAAAAGVVAMYFQIIAHIGADKPGMPGPSDAVDDVPSMLSLSLRGAACWLWGGAPLLLWLYVFRDRDVPLDQSAAVPIVALICLGMLYMPAVLIAIVLTDSAGALFWPPAWIKVIARAPSSYLKLVGLFMLSVIVLAIWTRMFGAILALVPLPGIGIVVGMVTNLLLFVQACLVGGFLRRNSDAFGWE